MATSSLALTDPQAPTLPPAGLLHGIDQACGAGSAPAGSVLWEEQRLAALDRYDILDTPKEEAFDRITRLTKKLFRVPFVIITMIDAHRAWSKSTQGIEFPEGPRSFSFCQHAILENRPLIVPDASRDPRFANSPYVIGEPHVRFYVGVPLTMSEVTTSARSAFLTRSHESSLRRKPNSCPTSRGWWWMSLNCVYLRPETA